MNKTELLVRLAQFSLDCQKTDATDFLVELKRLSNKHLNGGYYGTGNSKNNSGHTCRVVDFRLYAEQRLGVSHRGLSHKRNGVSNQAEATSVSSNEE